MTVLEEASALTCADQGCGTFIDDDRRASARRSARATQRISALGEMTTGLAHDFRNILAVIGSALNLAEGTGRDPDGKQAALAAARDALGRGTALADRLLVFARPDVRRPGVEDVNALLENLKLFLDYAAGPDIRIRLELEAGLPSCRIDAPAFGAAMLNLVVNARDAMPDGGDVRIVTHLIRLMETADGNSDRGAVLVRVIDRGHGMTREIRDRIFDPYFTTKGDTGTGLGVPQVASFMHAAGGCVNVSSEPGSGTSFDLYFPISDSPGLIGTNLWRQLDRWVNEGGRAFPPRFGH